MKINQNSKKVLSETAMNYPFPFFWIQPFTICCQNNENENEYWLYAKTEDITNPPDLAEVVVKIVTYIISIPKSPTNNDGYITRWRHAQ